MYRRAVTLMELVIAMAMLTIIFAVVLPQFAVIRNSWDIKQSSSEMLQNGRVLIDHINRNLSKARQIAAVTSSSIDFNDCNGNTYRYCIGASNYVQFGQPSGTMSDLAGPVSSLTFTCYDACDLSTPITNVANIRVVKIDAMITNSASLTRSMGFTTEVYLRSNVQTLEWSDQDIGSVAATGSATSSDCNWTVVGSGADIWSTADEFHYAYHSLSGDGQIVARVYSMVCSGGCDSWAKAGVMIRETLTTGSKHAMMVVTPGNGTAFQRRTTTNGTSAHTAGSSVVAPYWVKITRRGNTLTGYDSNDGATWNLVGSDTVTMATSVYIGLCVTSHNDGSLCTANFDNVSFLTYEAFKEAKAPLDTNTTISIATPSTNSGDLLIAAIATDDSTSATLTPASSGWTLINCSNYNSAVTLGVWRRFATSSEPSSYTFNGLGGNQAYGWIMRFAGCDPNNPINASASSGVTSSTPTSPAVTTTVDGCLILRLGAFDDCNITVDSPGLSGHSPITMDSSSSLSGGPLGYWKLDESSGTSAADSSGNGNNGTLHNMSSPGCWVSGKISNALKFDGSNDYVSLPVGSIIGSLTNCTIALWVYWNGASSTNWQRVWDFGTGTTYNMYLTTRNQYSGTPFFAITTASYSAEERTTAPSALTTGVWHHIAVTIDAGNHIHSLYIDGSLVAQNTSGSHVPSDLGNTTNNWLGQSQYYSVNNDPYFYGNLDDLRIYNRVLSAAEMLSLYQWTGGAGSGSVSGGAGYVRQSTAGNSGTSTFSLTASNEAQMLTIAIAPDANKGAVCSGGSIRP